MATSGSKTVAIFSSWLHMKFSWSQKSQSVENNTTTIAWNLQLTSGNGALYRYDRPWTVTIDGTKYSGEVTVDLDANSTQTLASGTATIDHNADGSKTFAYSFSMNFNLTLNNGTYMGTYSGSGSDTLTTIARASQPSLVTYPNSTANVGEFGETFSIHMNTASQSFTHVVRYSYGERSGTIATGVVNGTTWAVPLEFMNDIPGATSASGLIIVDTYSGSTKIGTKYTGFTVTVPASVKPSCSFVLEDVTGVDDIYGSPVKGLSKIKITVNSVLAYSSPIASVVITANGVKYTSSPATTDYLRTAGTSTVKATVTDKRGRSGSVSYDMTVQDYTPPAVTALAVRRCDADGTANDRGEYVKVTFSAAVSSMSSKNTAAYTLKYKKSADSTYTSVSLTALKNNYAVSNYSYIFAADGSSSYDVDVTVADRHGTASRSTSASTAFTLINFHPEGNALRFGGVAEEEDTFQNDLDFVQRGNRYVFSTPGVAGSAGYILMARLTHKKANADTPITFVFTRRLAPHPMTVHVQFRTDSTTIDPDLKTISYEGSNYGAFLVREQESVWGLYVQKVSAYDTITLQDWFSTRTLTDRLTVEFPGVLVSAVPDGLDGYYRATPAKLDSLLDHIYPVGSIYLSFSHNDPADLFGGTWERIQNAFLWAVDSSGTIGQTGGEKTHTLTASEMPAHQHNIAWTSSAGDVGNASQENPLVRYGETNIGYAGIKTTAVGGGAAHNNMPPYIQVSAWRRTA